MNILQIAPQIPLPLSDGGKVGIFNITKYLSERGHNITFVTFDRGDDTDLSPLLLHCQLVLVPHATKNSIFGAVKNLFSSRPYNISKYIAVKMERQIKKILDEQRIDIVHIDHLHMAHYGLLCKQLKRIPVILREHNIESSIVERYTEHVQNPLFKLYMSVQTKRIQRFEAEVTREFDCCAVITPDDEQRLRSMQPAAITGIVPGGVDSRYFLSEGSPEVAPKTIVFFGGFDWLPNQDALRWFLQQVMPKLIDVEPDSILNVVGKNVPKDLLQYASKNVVFKGFVEDLKFEVQSAAMTIAPIRIGGGIRLKILESFAMKVPVVSTTIGCEGIECTDGIDILIADTPEEFVLAIRKLFNDPSFRSSVGEQAYQLALNKYSWNVVAEKLEMMYNACIDK